MPGHSTTTAMSSRRPTQRLTPRRITTLALAASLILIAVAGVVMLTVNTNQPATQAPSPPVVETTVHPAAPSPAGLAAGGLSSSPAARGVSSSPAAGGVSPSPPPVVGPLTLPPDGPSAEPDGDSTPEADESVPSEPPGDAAPPLGDAAPPPADDARVVEDLVVDAESPVDEDLLVDEDVVVEADLLVDEDVVVDAESRVDEDVVVDEESRVDEDAEPESDGSAYAMPGVVATTIPTPRATANAPTRPMCLT